MDPLVLPSIEARFPDLNGKVAIVTGASRNIGAEIGRFLARQGMRVVLSGRSEELGQAVVEEIKSSGGTAIWTTADVATDEGAKKVFEAAIQSFGSVDLLVNNAAQKGSKPFLKLDEASYQDSFENNVRLVYKLSRLVVAYQAEKQQGGSIINISSVGGTRAHRGTVGYDASKGAMDAMTRAMAIELAPLGIRVNAIAPGMTLNDDQILNPNPRFLPKFKEIPAQRAGRCIETAAMVAFLASNAGTYIIGQVIYIDGGLIAQLSPPSINL